MSKKNAGVTLADKKSPLSAVKGVLSSGKQNMVIILAAVLLFMVFYAINPGFAKQGNLLCISE